MKLIQKQTINKILPTAQLLFKKGGMIPKYQIGAYFVPYRTNHGISFMGRGSGEPYSSQEVKDWLKEHGLKFTDQQFDNWVVKSNPISYTEYLNWNKTQPTQNRTNSTNKFQWNNKYWAKIGNKYKGLGYNDYMQEFNKWFNQQNFNSLEKDNRNYIAKQNWDRYVKLGYNKPVNTFNEVVVTPEKGSKTDDLNDNTSLAQTNEWKTKYEQVLKELQELKNSTKVETPAKTETPIVEESKNGNTYESIVEANTNLAKNRIFNSGWRGAFKDTLNQALMTPDYYNNGEGTQVFDFELPDGTVVNYDYLSGNGMLNKHGLLKAGAMRKLAKNFKQQGRNIAQQRYVGVGNQQILPNAAPVTNIVDTYEPNYGIRMIGTTTPILGPDWNGMKNEVEKYQQKEPDITV